jgi:hypothetical protein
MSTKLLSIARWSMLAALLGLWLPCHAQYSAVVQGTVTDSKGEVVQGASVTLTNTATNISDTTTTNGTGGYDFENLLPADYKIVVTATGFEKAVVNRHVSTDEVAGVNIALTVGRATVTVEVTAAEVGLNPDETRLEYTITSDDINNMPMPDRSTLTTLRVAPGIVGTIETSGSTNTNIPIGQATPDARANGRPASSNDYLLDRIPITSTENTGALNMIPNPDMLSEIALQSTTFAVENGATSSLQVDMTSKSGGNKYHGDFDINYTSKPFEANPDFSAGVTPFHRKYFMGSVGGPIIKGHTFFFGSIERVENLSASGAQASAFSASGIGAWTTAQYAAPPAGWNTAGQPWSTLFNSPATGLVQQAVSSTADTYYPNPAFDGGTTKGNKFGVECGTPSSFNLPCDTPITVTGLFNQSPGITGQQYNLRFDHSFNHDNDRLYVGYFGVQQNSAYIDPRPAFNTTTPSQSYYFSAGYSHIFAPTLTNQFNAGLNRFWGGGVGNPNYMVYPHGTYFGFLSDLGGFAGGPQESPDSPYIGADEKEHVLALRDYVSWLKGRHSMRLGFQSNIRNYWNNDAADFSRPYGTYFSDILEMMQGEADEYSLYTIGACGLSAAGGNCSSGAGKWISQVYGAEQKQFAAYVQDDWKIEPNLTVTFGIRWDDFGNPGEYGAGAVQYANTFLGTGSNLFSQVANVYGKVVSQAFTSGQTWNFLPRAAFSWEPRFAKKLVVRGGIGLYQDAINLNQITANLPTSTPIRLTLTLHDNAEPYGGCFFCGPGQWQGTGSTGTSGVAGEPGPFAITGTQGHSAPYGFPYPSIPVTGQLANGLSTGPGGTPYSANLYGVNPALKPQSTFIWNFGLEQELPDRVVVGATYTGSYSYNQFYQSNSYNNPPGSALATTATGYVAPPASQVGTIQLIENALTSNYNAVILTAQQRKGTLSWQANYLWSHALGEQPFNPLSTYGYGNLSIDTKNRFTLSGAYEVPGAKSGALRAATHGWTLGTVFIAQEGTPFTVFSSQDVNNDGQKDGNNDLPNVEFQSSGHLSYGGFSRAAFKQPTGIFAGACGGAGSSGNLYDATTYPDCPFQTVSTPNAYTLEGNEPFNAFRNPGYQDVDLNLQKKTELPWFSDSKCNLILRAEGLNALNRANLQGFGSSIVIGSTSNFGQVQGANNPRIIQIGARFEF